MRNEVIYSQEYRVSANKYLYNGKEIQDDDLFFYSFKETGTQPRLLFIVPVDVFL